MVYITSAIRVYRVFFKYGALLNLCYLLPKSVHPMNRSRGVRYGVNARYILVCILLLCCMLQNAAWAARFGNKFWTPLTLEGNYGSLLYFVEPQLRLIERTNLFNQFLNNAAIGHEILPGWQAWFGQTITTISQDALSSSKEEYRSWEQLVWKGTFHGINILSRTRLEERKSLTFPQWAFRIRELVRLQRPVASNFNIELINELFYNLNQVPWIETKTWDQDRAMIGVSQVFSKSRTLLVGYMRQIVFLEKHPRVDTVLVLNFRFYLDDPRTAT